MSSSSESTVIRISNQVDDLEFIGRVTYSWLTLQKHESAACPGETNTQLQLYCKHCLTSIINHNTN